uniref:Poly [ADP-ribose] polymerase n=1 Tax=Eutreptiella gymnastica TaxID=73025 RepID=A0A7S1HZD6_9EUGL
MFLHEDPHACEVYDCVVSLLSGAANSYRKASTLNPFPKAFVTENKDRDYDRLCECLKRLPSPEEMFSADRNVIQLDADQHSLMQFLSNDVVQLRKVAVAELQPHYASCASTLHPNYAFELVHNSNSSTFQEFSALKAQYGAQTAFHGSTIENWHCIVNTGLRNFSGTEKQKTGALFGEGIYLSTMLSVAADFSRSGEGWSNSTILGRRIRVVGLCEVVKHPELVNRKESDSTQRGASLASVPNAYIVAQSSACVKVKYLLIYTEKAVSKEDAKKAGNSYTLVMFYVVLLLAIVMSRAENQASVKYWSNKAYRMVLPKGKWR